MRIATAFLLVASVICPSVRAAGPNWADLKSINEQARCEHPALHHVIYRGNTEGLAPCLAQAGDGQIEELRISSGGGGAWEAMRLMQRYAGRIDLVVVEVLCASSCANYVIPAARRLRVEPGSYVLLHGSPNLRDLDPQKAATIEQLRAGMKTSQPGLSGPEIEKMADGAWDAMRDEVISMQPVQQAWARDTLQCDDWLDPHRHLDGPLPPGMFWLLVTPEMAQRCLRHTEIVKFWPPESEQEFSREVGFFRARR